MLRVFLFSILVACSSSSLSLEPYCDRNETVIEKVPIERTRQIIVKPSKWKFWKNEMKKTVIDTEYEERFKHKLVSACCEGFYMTDLSICEPVCEHGCPAFAKCVNPNHCKCNEGYISALSHKDGRPYCEPICETQCPIGMMCAAPNKCECRIGYQMLEDGIGQCIPTCKAGDGCRNGYCVGVERCVCHKNYTWEPKMERCEKLITAISMSAEELEEEIERETSIGYIEDSFDPTSMPSTTLDDNDDNGDGTITVTECPEGFILYKGECRAELFSSSDTGCNFDSCGQNQICLSNGTCTCAEDHIPQNSTDDNSLPSTELVCIHYLLNKITEPTAKESLMDTTMIGLIGLITICAAVILTLLAVKLLMHRKGRLDVEGKIKANLECEYTNTICDDSNEWVP